MNEAIDQGFDEFAPQPRVNTLIVRFYTDAIQDEQKTKEAGHPIWVDTEMIEIRIPGDKDFIARPATEEEKRRFAAEYDRDIVKPGKSEAVIGTPLKHWPEMTPALIKNLAPWGISTVEQLAAVPDANLANIGPFVRYKQAAKDWLAARKDSSLLTKIRAENNELRSRIAALEQMVATQSQDIAKAREAGGALPAAIDMEALTATLLAKMQAANPTKNDDQPPKRRGRPPGTKNKPKEPTEG